MSESLVHLLSLEASSDNLYTAPPSPEIHVRAFGGRTVAQALTAATATVTRERRVHSLHSYFMLPGDSSRSMDCEVIRLRDGASFSVRRVDAFQSNSLIFTMLASFHRGERGPQHQDEMPVVALPEDLPSFEERFSSRDQEDDMQRWFFRAEPFDIRYANTSPFEGVHPSHSATQQVWIKAKALPDDPGLHSGALTYASDMTILDPVLLRHGIQWTDRAMLGATLDHSVWFHRQVDFNQWHLFDQSSSVGHDGRVLATANIWTEAGDLAVTVSQEALMRDLRPNV